MMRISSTLLLKAETNFFIILLQISSIAFAADMNCSASSCGIIGNISYPFHLSHDPHHCGLPDYELECQNNVTLYLNYYLKYRVEAINYNNFTIRLVDDTLDNKNTCSFPTYSAYQFEFTSSDYPYSYILQRKSRYPYSYGAALPINLMSCPRPLDNSSLFTQLPFNCTTKATYIKPGHMNASDVPYACSIDLIVMTSWKFKNTSVSLSEIHHSLLYGFELSWFNYPCFKCARSDLCDVGKDHKPICNDESWPWTTTLINTLAIIVALLLGMVNIPIAVMFTFGYAFFVDEYHFLPTVHWRWFLAPAEDILPVGSLLGLLIYAGIFCAIKKFILFPFAVGFMIRKFRRRHLSMYDAIEDFLQSDNKLMPVRYSYSDIKGMTRCFQEKLGQGGYGMVYKGRLWSGHHVAVKLLGKLRANDQDFMNEIATIGRIHHVNVVKLVGYCAERAKRALVYDFMPNGSLDKYIFSEGKTNCLNWEMKYKIAVGVARGIEYLHRGCDVQILHFDIKPHNILLDDNFIPKISDFGLAKLCSTDKHAVTMTAARGTIGYVAPELINRGFGEVSYKVDVYSFGMLLIEMVGIKRDLKGNNQSSSQYFPDWIYGCLEQGKEIECGKSIEEIVEDEEGSRKIGRKMTIVALWCIQMRPNDRPSMNQVVKMLEEDIEQVQIPERPAQSSQFAMDMDQSLSTHSTDVISLLHHDAAASPSIEITVEE